MKHIIRDIILALLYVFAPIILYVIYPKSLIIMTWIVIPAGIAFFSLLIYVLINSIKYILFGDDTESTNGNMDSANNSTGS